MTREQQQKGNKAKHDKLTEKQKAFAKEYVKTKNGTQSILSAGYRTSKKGASALAVENLAKPSIREEIAKLLADSGIEMATVLDIHRRNLVQDKHLPTSQKAVNDYYELVGLKDQKTDTSVKVAFIVEK